MTVSTVTSENLSAATLQERYDRACKVVLANKIFLARILKGCVDEFKNSTYDEIINCIEGTPEIGDFPVRPDSHSKINGLSGEDTSIYENTVYYDVKFDAAIPNSKDGMRLIINLEAQKKYNTGYPLIKRGIYYACRLISSQYGREFEHSHYEKIQKVYSVWICMDAPKKYRNSITEYSLFENNILGEVHEKRKNYDLAKVVMICLGKVDKDSGEILDCDNTMLRFLNVLLADSLDIGKRKTVLQNEFGIDMTGEPEKEVKEMCNLSYGILEQGIEQGKTLGIAQGEFDQKIKSISKLMQKFNIDFNRAADILDIPDSERDKCKESILKN